MHSHCGLICRIGPWAIVTLREVGDVGVSDPFASKAFTLRTSPANSFPLQRLRAIVADWFGIIGIAEEWSWAEGDPEQSRSNVNSYQKCHKSLLFVPSVYDCAHTMSCVVHSFFSFLCTFCFGGKCRVTGSVHDMGGKPHFPFVFVREPYSFYWGLWCARPPAVLCRKPSFVFQI